MAKKITKRTRKQDVVTREQFNFGLAVAMGLFRVQDGKVLVPDMVTALNIKVKFPIPIPEKKTEKK